MITDGVLLLDLSGIPGDVTEVNLLDTRGRVKGHQSLDSGKNEAVRFELSGFRGLMFLQIKTRDGAHHRKIVI